MAIKIKYFFVTANSEEELKKIKLQGMSVDYHLLIKDDGTQFTQEEYFILKLKGIRFLRNGRGPIGV